MKQAERGRSGATDKPRERRVRLDRDGIVAAALDVAADGRAVTFRALGEGLGVDPTAIYRHFRDKDELVRALMDDLLRAMAARVDHTQGWRPQLHAGAEGLVDLCVAHPWIGSQATKVATGGPGELAAIDWILGNLKAAGLSRPQIVRYYAAYSGFVLSAAANLSWNRLSEGDSTSSWLGEVRAVDAARMPALAELLPDLLALSGHEVFAVGVDVLLDSIAAASGR